MQNSTATSSMVSSSNLTSIMESPAELSQHITFNRPSPPDISQHSIRMAQYVPRNPAPSHCVHPIIGCPTAQMPDDEEIFANNAGMMPLSSSQWISHILDQGQEDTTDQRANPHGGLASMRSLWEDRCSEETELKQYEDQVNAALYARRQFLFPKWRSVDPLTASLVASHTTQAMIPLDSRIPQHRHDRLMETERMAPYAKLELHKPYIEQEVSKQLQKDAKRMFVRSRPKNPDQMARARASELLLHEQKRPSWYDLAEIRQQISHESIANVRITRQLFDAPNADGTVATHQCHRRMNVAPRMGMMAQQQLREH